MRRTFCTSVVIAIAMVGGFTTRASAQCPNAGPFCIDGVITATNNSGLAPQALFTSDPSGTKEFGPINGSNTKVAVINFAAPPILGDTTMPSKVDLTGVYTQAAVQGNDFWFYYAWTRATTSGSGFMAVEFERAAKPTVCSANYDPFSTTGLAGCNPWANRDGDGTPGNSDFMILWDQTGNAIGPQNIFVRFYNKSLAAFGTPQNLTLAGSAVAVYGGNGSDPSKGEMALNFSAIVGGLANQCLTFANIIPNTVTGNSDTADYKDTVLSNFPIASNCGTVTVKKVTVPGSTGVQFQYTLTDGSPMFGAPTPDSDCEVTGSNLNTCIGLLVHNEVDTITNLLQSSNYALVESVIPSSYALSSIVCTPEGGTAVDLTTGGTFTVAATKTTACVITNALRTGVFRVVKNITNGFGLTATCPQFSFALDALASQAWDSTCQTDFTLPFGSTHSAAETGTLPAGFVFDHADNCSNVVISGSLQTCTIYNKATIASPQLATAQKIILHDRANITGIRRGTADTNGGAKQASVSFQLFAGSSCQGTAVATEPVAVNFGVDTTSTQITVGTSTGFTVTFTGAGASGTPRSWSWKAVYGGNDYNAATASDASACNEAIAVTISGNAAIQ